jgi:hypothetical protein
MDAVATFRAQFFKARRAQPGDKSGPADQPDGAKPAAHVHRVERFAHYGQEIQRIGEANTPAAFRLGKVLGVHGFSEAKLMPHCY